MELLETCWIGNDRGGVSHVQITLPKIIFFWEKGALLDLRRSLSGSLLVGGSGCLLFQPLDTITSLGSFLKRS